MSFVEYALFQLSSMGLYCGDVVHKLICYPNLDLKKLDGSGETVSRLLLGKEFGSRLNIECFIMLAYRDPGCFYGDVGESSAFMQAIINVARVDDKDIGKITILSRFVPSSLRYKDEEKGTIRFFEAVTPSYRNRFKYIPDLVKNFIIRQDSDVSFIRGVIRFFIGCKYTPYVDDLKKAFVDVLDLIPFVDMFNALGVEKLKRELLSYMQTDGMLILTGWKGHVVSLWIKGDLLFRCNGGSCVFDSSIEVYRITKTDSLTIDLVSDLYAGRKKESNKILLQQKLHSILGLKLVMKYRGAFQRSANCSLHSVLLGVLAIVSSNIRDNVIKESFNEAAVVLSNLIFELKIIGIIKQIKRDIEQAEVLISRGISMAHGKRSRKDQQLYQYIFEKRFLPVDEIMFIPQIYSYLLLQSEGTLDDLDEYEVFLSTLGLFPFSRSEALGVNSTVLLKILSLDGEVSDLEILEFHRNVEDFTLLHVAVITNNKPLVNRLLDMEPELLEQKNINNVTPVGYANDLEMLKLLLGYGALVNWGGSYKETILAKILKRANYEMVEEVLVAGARVEPQSLIDASANTDVRVQRLLLNVVAGVEDLRASNGRTALHAVAMRGTVEHLRNVLSIDSVRAAQADINGVTPLWFAVMSKRMDMAFALCQHPQIIVFRPYRGDKFSDLVVERSEEHSEERSQLDLIIRMRQEKIENLDYFRDDFMQREEFISIRETARENPIEWFILAVGKNDFRAFKGALLHYPEISISTYNHTFASTVLHRALEVNISTDFMHMLLSLPGIDLRCINGAGETLAQVAAMHDNVKVLKMLSDLGAPMNTPDTIGVTPLMDAADRGCVNAVRYLLSIPGLDSGYRNYMGRNALDMAKSTRCYNVSIHKMLEEHSQRSCQLDVFRCMDYPLRHLRPKARV